MLEVKSITELAKELFQQVQFENRSLDNITLIGYSMGGLVAFEAAKLIEKNNGKINKIIILDKTAQTNNIQGDIREISSELYEYVDLLSISESDKGRMTSYLNEHMKWINGYQQKDTIQSNITIYYCGGEAPSDEILDWKKHTKGEATFKQLKDITHYEIPTYWNQIFDDINDDIL